MKAAFSYKGNRIAPVFDVARQILVIEVEEGRVISSFKKKLEDDPQIRNAVRLAEMGIEILVCGAVSTSLHSMISAYGIYVIPFVTGCLNDIISAWINDCLNIDNEFFFMPGYRNHGWHGGRNTGLLIKQEDAVNQGIKKRSEQGGGRGHGGCRQGSMRGQNTSSICVCPACGKTLPHERGNPCFEKQCPECGTTMVRG